MDERRRLAWVDSAGGPLLVVPGRWAAAWEGSNPPSAGRVVEATFRYDPSGRATDYDRTCDVTDPVAVIPVGRGRALVLGGEPLSTAYYRWNRGHFLLRWRYAGSEAELLDHFHDVQPGLAVDHEVPFRHPGGHVVLMDAADFGGRWVSARAEFPLPRGRYAVRTGQSQSDATAVVVHHLRPDGRSDIRGVGRAR